MSFYQKDSSRYRKCAFDIRTICMDDFPSIANTDEYIGFLYGMYSSNHDIECIFIDGILKHADISIENIPEFIDRLKKTLRGMRYQFLCKYQRRKSRIKGH